MEEKLKKTKQYFSGYQYTCLVGRLQDYCDKKKVEWETICDKLADIAKKMDDGTGNIGACYDKSYAFIDKIVIKQISKNIGGKR